MSSGPIFALDLGRRMGVVDAIPGDRHPLSYAVELADPTDGLTLQLIELTRFLNARFLRAPRPSLVIKEAPLNLAAFRALASSDDSVRSAYALHGVVSGISGIFRIPCLEVAVGRITKHFTDKARHGGRMERKRAIIARCRALGYVDRSCVDEDRCDALACWDWACAHIERRPNSVVLFNPAE